MAPQTRRILNVLYSRMFLCKTPIRRLPIEIEYQALSFLLDELDVNNTTMAEIRDSVQPMLRALACVCRAWCSFVTPALYRDIFLSSPKALASLTVAVTTYPHLQQLVRSFQYCSMMFRHGRVEISQAEAINLERIYTVCTNMLAKTIRRGSRRSVQNYRKAVLEYITLLSGPTNLTRLEIILGGKFEMVLPPQLTFDSLRELVLTLEEDRGEWADSSSMEQWLRMPLLARLCIRNDTQSFADFRFHLPECSDKLRVIELFGTETWTIDNFFEVELRKLANTLESLTIVLSPYSVPGWTMDLTYFQRLSELCFPLKAFSMLEEYVLPDSLRRLVISGQPTDEFCKDDLLLYIPEVDENLCKLFELKAKGLAVKNLNLVRVMAERVPKYFARAAKLARAAQVDFKYGFPQDKESLWKRILQ